MTKTQEPASSWLLRGALSLLYLVTAANSAIVQKYCSSQNTASNDAEIYNFQSNGHCQGVCSDYAFAVVQYQSCWCSNYVPYNQVSVSSCDKTCPGYPYENCGNQDSGLFGYIANSKAPSGTKGAPAASSTTSASSSTSGSTTKGSSTVAAVVTTVVNSVGSVITVTSTPTLPASTEKLQPSKGVNGGVVAGIVVAVVIGLLAVIGAFFFLWMRRHRRGRDDDDEVDPSAAPQRMNSQMSKSGLLGATAVPTFAFRRTTPPQTSGDTALGGGSPNERRKSQPFLYDQRLNPQALMIHEDLSRNSINTIDDGRDYGRRLNVTNPDVEDRERS